MAKILIIGAGIHGVTMALELAKNNEVTMIDSNKDLLLGTSKSTHNRIHLGYHYPRSRETIRECRLGYDFFKKNYRDCLLFPDFYYVIERKSKINSIEYKKIMEEEGLECSSSWPSIDFLEKKNIQDSFKVEEACIDVPRLREKIRKKLRDLKIKTFLNFKLQKVQKVSKNKIILASPDRDIPLDVDLIINCTYTNCNNILKIFGIKDHITKYSFEETEIAVVRSSIKIPALTVMDGPFISILPYAGHKNLYLVYDVVNSVINNKKGFCFRRSSPTKSTWEKMLKHGLMYYPFFSKLKYLYSLYGNRPIPLSAKGDSRVTRIVKQKYDIDFYSVKEGKFISAPLIAAEFSKTLQNAK
jgi:hypothetical protein